LELILLAGGLGTRLRPVIGEKLKPLASVAGEPLLSKLLRNASRAGFTRVVLAVSYRHEDVTGTYGQQFEGMSISYSVEPTPLGTGGAIKQALKSCSGEHVAVQNADTFVNPPWAAMMDKAKASSCKVVVGVTWTDDTSRYGMVHTNGERISAFGEKQATGAGLINAGVYVLSRSIFDGLPLPESFSFEKDYLTSYVKEAPFLWVRVEGAFIDIGTPADYLRAAEYLQKYGSTKSH
jgi:D-glycero-alpha-D-manno-heptose 1-phosphate guanylyltransferase